MKKLMNLLKRLHRCEQGAEGLEKILILAAIVIPLLGVLIFFRGRITELVSEAWENMTGKGDVTDQVNPDIP